MIVYLNDKFLDENLASVSIRDAGFLYGEGVFTTLRLYQGCAPDLDKHWLRLRNQTQILGIPFPLTLEEAGSIVTDLVARNAVQSSDARLRITVTRGESPFSFNPESQQLPTILLTVTPLPSAFDQANIQGVSVISLGCEFLRTHLPQLKTLNCMSSLLAMREAQSKSCPEAFVFDEHDLLTEGAVSNVFIVKDGSLLTPADDGRILAGITRQKVMALAGNHQIACTEKALTRQDVQKADEVFFCNSIRQIVPVIRLDENQVAAGLPGPLTVKISSWYMTDVTEGRPHD